MHHKCFCSESFWFTVLEYSLFRREMSANNWSSSIIISWTIDHEMISFRDWLRKLGKQCSFLLFRRYRKNTVTKLAQPLWEPTSQRSPHLHYGSRLTFSSPLSYISFSCFTFPGAPYRIFLPSSWPFLTSFHRTTTVHIRLCTYSQLRVQAW